MATREALADAIAGVAGSLVSMLTFYPIDVIKTNLQASSSSSSSSSFSSSLVSPSSSTSCHYSLLSLLPLIRKIFRGLHFKAAHTITSSFAYFFIYSLIKSQHQKMSLSNHRPSTSTSTSTSTRLLLSALAGIINVLLTFPLDVLAARSQMRINTSTSLCAAKPPGTSHATHIGDNQQQQYYEDEEKIKKNNKKKEESYLEKDIQQQDNTIIMDNVCDYSSNSNDQHDFHTTHTLTDQSHKTDEDDFSYETATYISHDNDNCIMKNINMNEKLLFSDEDYDNNDNDNDYNIIHNHTCTRIINIEMTNSIPTASQREQSYSQESLSSSCQLPPIHYILDLWSGITPALLLCSNPAINYTIYDIVKDYILLYKRNHHHHHSSRINDNDSSSGSSSMIIQINMMEAFCIGIISKFAATIITYPLIRAKVMLMVTKKEMKKMIRNPKINNSHGHDDNKCDHDNDENNNCSTANISCNKKQKDIIPINNINNNQSMFQILYKIYMNEGIKGLYKGCGLQLIHTILKSALLMMVRERITLTTRRLIVSSTTTTTMTTT